jgi:hypothetical protein
MTRLFLIIASLVLLITAAGCAKSAQVADGVEVKVTKIERARSITIGMSQATARPGNDIARVFYELTAASNVKEMKLPVDQQEVIDTDGKSYKSDADLSFTFGSGGGKMSFDSMFEVPTGATLKTLKLGRAMLDVSGLEGAKPKP